MPCGVALYAFLTVLGTPDERGPHQFATLDAGRVSAAGEMIPLLVYYPTDLATPGPLVAVVHGYVRNGSFMAEMARTIASRGMIAIVPDMPCGLVSGCDHVANGAQISALIDWAINEAQSNMMSPLYGIIDAQKLGVIGHSWGGLGIFMSALNDPRYLSVVALDPNDDRSLAAGLASTMMHPTMHIMAEVPGSCNATNWGETVYPLTPAPHMRIRIVGSGHCDVEDPSDNFCPTFCGSGNAATTPLFRRYAIAWTECMLLGAGPEWIGGASFDDDVTRGAVDNVDSAMLDSLPCRSTQPPPSDAGLPPPDDAGAPVGEDAAETFPDANDDPPDAGAEEPADSGAMTPPPDAGKPPSSSDPATVDDGCRCVQTSSPAAFWLLFPLIAIAATRKKSRR